CKSSGFRRVRAIVQGRDQRRLAGLQDNSRFGTMSPTRGPAVLPRADRVCRIPWPSPALVMAIALSEAIRGGGRPLFAIRRREFSMLLGAAAPSLAWPLAARAEQAGKRYAIGLLSAGTDTLVDATAAFTDALRELGWI